MTVGRPGELRKDAQEGGDQQEGDICLQEILGIASPTAPPRGEVAADLGPEVMP